MKWAGFQVLRKSLQKKHKAYGYCNWAKGQIVIDKKIRGSLELDTFIHEGLHALDPNLDENYVMNTARQLAALLHKAGYRRPKD